MNWFNYKTGQWEKWDKGSAPDNLQDYIPQTPEAQNLYNMHKYAADVEIASAIEILTLYAGTRREQQS